MATRSRQATINVRLNSASAVRNARALDTALKATIRSTIRLNTQLTSLNKTMALSRIRAGEFSRSVGGLSRSTSTATARFRILKSEINNTFNPAVVNRFNARLTAARGGIARSGRGIGNLLGGRGLASAFSVYQIAAFAKSTLDVTRELDSMRRKLEIAFPGQGHKGLDRAIAQADEYGLALRSVTEGYTRFAASLAGTELAGSTDALYNDILKISGALRLNEERMRGLVFAFEQMVSKGKITAEELRRQLGDRLPGAVRLFADALGITTQELDEKLKRGILRTADILPIALKYIGEQMEQAAELAKDSIDSVMNRFSNQILLTQEALFLAVADGWFKTGVKAATEWLKGFEIALEEEGVAFAGGVLTVKTVKVLFDFVTPTTSTFNLVMVPTGRFAQGAWAEMTGELEKLKDYDEMVKEMAKEFKEEVAAERREAELLKPKPLNDEDRAALEGAERSLRSKREAAKFELDKAVEALNRIILRGGVGVERALAAREGLNAKFHKDMEDLEWKAAKKRRRIAERGFMEAKEAEDKEHAFIQKRQKEAFESFKQMNKEQERLDKEEAQRQRKLRLGAEELRSQYDDLFAAVLTRDRKLVALEESGPYLSSEATEKIRAGIAKEYAQAEYEATLTDTQIFARDLVTNFKDAARDAVVSGNFDDFGQAVFRALQASLFDMALDKALDAFGRTDFGRALGLGKFHRGGLVGGPTGAEIPVMAQAGELILTQAQQSNVAGQLSGGSPIYYSPQFSMIGSVDAATANFFAQNERRLARNLANTVRQARIGR